VTALERLKWRLIVGGEPLIVLDLKLRHLWLTELAACASMLRPTVALLRHPVFVPISVPAWAPTTRGLERAAHDRKQ
jgi:hypothetical protein